jgi:hypothetical protein
MGDWDTAGSNEPLPNMEFMASKVFYHPNYTASNLQNSVAIIRLKTAVPLGRFPTIGTACLARKKFES